MGTLDDNAADREARFAEDLVVHSLLVGPAVSEQVTYCLSLGPVLDEKETRLELIEQGGDLPGPSQFAFTLNQYRAKSPSRSHSSRNDAWSNEFGPFMRNC